MELEKEINGKKNKGQWLSLNTAQFNQIFSMKPIEVSEKALKKIEIYDKFEIMKHVFTSTRDNLCIFNSKMASILGMMDQRVRGDSSVNNCPVLRVRDLFNNF